MLQGVRPWRAAARDTTAGAAPSQPDANRRYFGLSEMRLPR